MADSACAPIKDPQILHLNWWPNFPVLIFIYCFFKFRKIPKLSKDLNPKFPLVFGSNSLLQREWQMSSHFSNRKDTRYVKNHGFLHAKDKVAQLHSCSFCAGFRPRLEQCFVHLIPAGQSPIPLPQSPRVSRYTYFNSTVILSLVSHQQAFW